MSVTAEDLKQYEKGNRVVVVKNLNEPNEAGESAVEVEGTVEAVNQMGMLIKPKGRVNLDLIELAQIEEISFAAEKLTTIKQKTLQPITYGNARKHLASAHGIELTWLNANSEEAALKFHNDLDHTNLGHKHEAKDEAKDEAATNAA